MSGSAPAAPRRPASASAPILIGIVTPIVLCAAAAVLSRAACPGCGDGGPMVVTDGERIPVPSRPTGTATASGSQDRAFEGESRRGVGKTTLLGRRTWRAPEIGDHR